MRLNIVDVFAEAPLQGNQLAVIRDAQGLDTASMQAIAREMNFSETTFVTEEHDNHAVVRIFTPSNELPFAGHPTLGTAWVLARERDAYRLSLGVGVVPVRFDAGLAWMTPPKATFGEPIEAASAAQCIGLKEHELDRRYPACHVQCGPRFKLVFVRALESLERASALPEAVLDEACFVVCEEGRLADSQFTARMFFHDGASLREDPATGSANSAFATYLRDRGRRGSLRVDQGYEIGRPSRIYIEIGAELAVGGKVQPVAEGKLTL